MKKLAKILRASNAFAVFLLIWSFAIMFVGIAGLNPLTRDRACAYMLIAGLVVFVILAFCRKGE